MEKKNVNLVAKPISFSEINKDFVRARCYVMAIGKNKNGLYISKDAVDRAMPSLSYIPVVAHILYDEEEDKFYVGGHDIDIKVEGSSIIVKDLTVPYGVVLGDTSEYVEVEEKDGTIATYLAVDIIIWASRYPEIMKTIYSDDVYWSQSMEVLPLSMQEFPEDKDYVELVDYKYSCLTLLGKDDNPEFNTVPCFPSSRVEPVKFNASDNFNKEFENMIDKLKELSFCFENQDNGEKNMSDIRVDNNVENKDILLFSATFRERLEAMVDVMPNIIEKDKDGNISYEVDYYVQDFDDEYVFVKKYEYKEKEYSETVGRFKYELLEDNTIELKSDFEKMINLLVTVEEHDRITAERDAAEKELKELKEFKDNTLSKQREEAIESVFSMFEDISNTKEFIELKNNHSEMTVEEIEEKCFSIKGRQTFSVDTNKKKNSVPKVPAKEREAISAEPYGGLFKKLNISK